MKNNYSWVYCKMELGHGRFPWNMAITSKATHMVDQFFKKVNMLYTQILILLNIF